MNPPEGLTLPDGRNLSWAEYGDTVGNPLLYMHGTPSCHIEAVAFGGGGPFAHICRFRRSRDE